MGIPRNEALKRNIRSLLAEAKTGPDLDVLVVEAEIRAFLARLRIHTGPWEATYRKQYGPPAHAEKVIRDVRRDMANAPTKISEWLATLRALVDDNESAWAQRLERLGLGSKVV